MACALAAGCGGGSAPAFVARDSAGVRIAESRAPAWRSGAGWTVADTPELSIGVVQGDSAYQLYQVRGAVRLSDGTIVIANAGTNQLRFYDARGRFERAVGGEGGAPGEFRGLLDLVSIPGDTLVAFDWRLQRVSLLAPDGTLAGTVRLTTPEGGGLYWPAGALDGAHLLALFRPGVGTPGEGYRRDTARFVMLDSAGRRTADFGRFAGGERFLSLTRQGGVITSMEVSTIPFSRGAYATTGDGRVWAGSSDRFEIREFAPNGKLLGILRRTDVTPVTVTDAMKSRAVAARLAARKRAEPNLSTTDLASARKALAALPVPPTTPTFGPLHVDPDGNLWVSDFKPSWAEADPTRWSVFEPDGRWLGTVATPAGLEVYEIGHDYVLGLRKDDLGVEHVDMYALTRKE